MGRQRGSKLPQSEINQRTNTYLKNAKERLIELRGNREDLSNGSIFWCDMFIAPYKGSRRTSKCNFVPILCHHCKQKRFEPSAILLSRLASKQHTFSGRCHKCSNARIRENNGAWKGGKNIGKGGYIRLRVHPKDELAKAMANNGYVLEHRLVLARALGQPIPKDLQVHHINGNKQDNRLENLIALDAKTHGKINLTAILRERIAQLENLLTTHNIPIPNYGLPFHLSKHPNNSSAV